MTAHPVVTFSKTDWRRVEVPQKRNGSIADNPDGTRIRRFHNALSESILRLAHLISAFGDTLTCQGFWHSAITSTTAVPASPQALLCAWTRVCGSHAAQWNRSRLNRLPRARVGLLRREVPVCRTKRIGIRSQGARGAGPALR